MHSNLKQKSKKLFNNLNQMRLKSIWGGVKAAPADPVFGVTEAWRADKNPNKVLLGVGAYRDDLGKPYILPCVRQAEEKLLTQNLNHEYLPQMGMAEFCNNAAKLALSDDNCSITNGQNLTFQSLSGTGALRLGLAFLKAFYPGNKEVYLPNPTWANHKALCTHSGLPFKLYKYYDKEGVCLDFCGMKTDLSKIPETSIVLFHAVAHNPTGFDPNDEEWDEISCICKKRELFVFFDMAYQGFASGDPDYDARIVRRFLDHGHQIAVAQSFAKNMGLYGQRIGAITFIAESKEQRAIMKTQMDIIVRAMYSNPPLHGARIVNEILGTYCTRIEWQKQTKGMADRIKFMRTVLVDNLKKAGSQKDWGHINRQVGMFSFTGLTTEQVEALKKQHSVYMTSDGRMSVASLGSKNVEYVAKAIHEVTK